MRFNHQYILKCLSVLDKKFKTLQTVKTILRKNGAKDEHANNCYFHQNVKCCCLINPSIMLDADKPARVVFASYFATKFTLSR